MSQRIGHLRSTLLFSAVPALSAMAPLIAIPVVTSTQGLSAWAAVAVGSSVGGSAGMLAELGWTVVGPQQIAYDPHSATRTFILAIVSKIVAVAILAGPVVCITTVVVQRHDTAAAIAALAVLIQALSSNWFFVGTDQPTKIILTDAAPKFLATVVGTYLLSLGAPLIAYCLALLLGALVSAVLPFALVPISSLTAFPHLVDLLRVIKTQRIVILGRAISTTYTTLPATIVGSIGIQHVAPFASIDRPLRMGLLVLQGVPAKFQAWISQPTSTPSRRARTVLFVNVLLGLLAGSFFALAGRLLLKVLFVGQVEPSIRALIWGGILVVAVCTSRGLGLVLVANMQANKISVSSTASALTGISLLVLLTEHFGYTGALASLACAELIGVGVQLYFARPFFHPSRDLMSRSILSEGTLGN